MTWKLPDMQTIFWTAVIAVAAVAVARQVPFTRRLVS